jgi:hypothetical protein
MQTVIRSARQDAIEPNKPRFQFWFADEPQFAVYELRGRIAHMLKCYRAHPERYQVRKLATHDYAIQVRGADAAARIGA